MLININAFQKSKISQHTKFEKPQKIQEKIRMALTVVVLKWQNVVFHLSSDNMNIESMTCLKKK